MKCEDTWERIEARRNGALDEHEARQLDAHLESCGDCRAASSAGSALRMLRARYEMPPPAGLFERVMRRSTLAGEKRPAASRFWLGAGVGAAVAASLMLAILGTGLLDTTPEAPAAQPSLRLAPGEARPVNIAIEMERDLEDAVITVALTGGIELDGYAGRRELSWRTDLQAGTNKLTLPLVAIGKTGGRLLVRVGHGDKERRFAMSIDMES